MKLFMRWAGLADAGTGEDIWVGVGPGGGGGGGAQVVYIIGKFQLVHEDKAVLCVLRYSF